MTAIISLDLAIVNFLPIPALDGGHVMFLLIEKLRGKPLDEENPEIKKPETEEEKASDTAQNVTITPLPANGGE